MKLTTVPLAILFSLMLNGALAAESQEIISQAIPVPLPVWVETSVVLNAMKANKVFREAAEECKVICPLPPEEASASASLVRAD